MTHNAVNASGEQTGICAGQSQVLEDLWGTEECTS